MQRRDDEEYEPLDIPNNVTDEREYIDNLRALGNDPESKPDLGKSLRPGVRAYKAQERSRAAGKKTWGSL